ncbi:MAG: hypothetical protein HC771_13035 [Synechococcales cyanobacterium CRU_2_2]|nr:hypothetical protein [Synechococcales cyanobacterium CRU_2_2]
MAIGELTLFFGGHSLILSQINIVEGKVLRKLKYEQTLDRTADGERRYEGPFHPNPYLYEIEARITAEQVDTLEMFFAGWTHIIGKQGANTINPGNLDPSLTLRDERAMIKQLSVDTKRPVAPGYTAESFLFGVRYYPQLRVDFASEPQIVDGALGRASTGECFYSASFTLEEQDLD